MTVDQKKERILGAIDDLFGDKSVDPQALRDALLDIAQECKARAYSIKTN